MRDADELARRAVSVVAETIFALPTTRFALAGGSTPLACYRLLAKRRDLPWGRVSVFFSDERCVPPDHADSNYAAALGALLRYVDPGAVHRIAGELGADSAAALYAPDVAAAPLDLVLLGIGPDGHTASLFPGNAALDADGYVAAVHDAPKPPPDRVTLTLRALREARRVVVLASGSEKADAVGRARAGEVPAGLIAHAEWILSEDAATKLQEQGARA